MEAHGTAEVDPSLRSRGEGRGLEGALAASCPLRDIPEQRHSLQNRSSVVFYLVCKGCISLIGGNGLAICSLQEDWTLLPRNPGRLRSVGEKYLVPSGFEVQLL